MEFFNQRDLNDEVALCILNDEQLYTQARSLIGDLYRPLNLTSVEHVANEIRFYVKTTKLTLTPFKHIKEIDFMRIDWYHVTKKLIRFFDDDEYWIAGLI